MHMKIFKTNCFLTIIAIIMFLIIGFSPIISEIRFRNSNDNSSRSKRAEQDIIRIEYLDSLYNVKYSALKDDFNMENSFKYMRETSDLCDELCAIGKKHYKDTEIYNKVFDSTHGIMKNQLDVINEFNKDVNNVFLVRDLMKIYDEEHNKASVVDSLVMEDINKLTYKTLGVKAF